MVLESFLEEGSFEWGLSKVEDSSGSQGAVTVRETARALQRQWEPEKHTCLVQVEGSNSAMVVGMDGRWQATEAGLV